MKINFAKSSSKKKTAKKPAAKKPAAKPQRSKPKPASKVRVTSRPVLPKKVGSVPAKIKRAYDETSKSDKNTRLIDWHEMIDGTIIFMYIVTYYEVTMSEKRKSTGRYYHEKRIAVWAGDSGGTKSNLIVQQWWNDNKDG